MRPDQEELLWIAAFRYCLGRRTYIVGEFVALLLSQWQKLSHNARQVIGRDLLEAFARDDRLRELEAETPDKRKSLSPLGDTCDRVDWDKVRRVVESSSTVEVSIADQMGWHPIETAPKDGTPILVCGRSYNDKSSASLEPQVASYCTSYPGSGGAKHWRDSDGYQIALASITHWRPLPPDPSGLTWQGEPDQSLPVQTVGD